jgi:hypothetical protein
MLEIADWTNESGLEDAVELPSALQLSSELHFSEVLGALSNQHREILEALYEQLIVGSSIDLQNLANDQGLSYAATYERLEAALAELGR